MKKALLSCLCIVFAVSVGCAQEFPPTAPDTLFYENFDADTFDIPLGHPTGADQGWVNYDEDGTRQVCFDGEDTFGWFPYFDVNDSLNFTFTSCSFNKVGVIYCPPNKPNRNWLIMPPVYIAHEKTFLEWKSLVIQGPMFHDGFRVLVSTTNNFPGSFTREIFRMAENLDINPPSSLDPNAHNFSSGYIQADAYQLHDYYVMAADQAGFIYLQGVLEPHKVSLSDFVGKTIYIAILHDADCDFGIQVDDLLVIHDESSSTQQPIFLSEVLIAPNPAQHSAVLNVELYTPVQAQLSMVHMDGRLVFTKDVSLYGGKNTLQLDLQDVPVGAYRVILQTPDTVRSALLMRR